jgi:hypothetical protein
MAAAAIPLVSALITQVLVPEIAAVIRAHHNATGNMPTDAQVIAALGTDSDGVITTGQAWLAAHGEAPVPAPTPPKTP